MASRFRLNVPKPECDDVTDGGDDVAGGGDRPDGSRIHTPRLGLGRRDGLQPVSEDDVIQQTGNVFVSFSHDMYTRERTRLGEDNTPNYPELTCNPPFSDINAIGRQLAAIGDDLHARYHGELDSYVRDLNANENTAYEDFVGVARKVFAGGANWGRVVMLLVFGYRLSVSVLQRGLAGLFSRVVDFVCRYFVETRFSQWVAEQGGWGAVTALRYVTEQPVSLPLLAAVAVVTALGTLAAVYLLRR